MTYLEGRFAREDWELQETMLNGDFMLVFFLNLGKCFRIIFEKDFYTPIAESRYPKMALKIIFLMFFNFVKIYSLHFC